MSSINGVGNNQPIYKAVSPPVSKSIPAAAGKPARASDKVELSGMSSLLKTLKTNDVRTDKVSQVKAQIEAGTYETDDKLNTAIDRLLDDLA